MYLTAGVLATVLGACGAPDPSEPGTGAVDAGTPPRQYPDASSTGAATGLPTRPVEEVTKPGTVIADVLLRQQLTISADDVVVRNVHIETPTFYGVLVQGTNVLLEDVTVVGTPGESMVCVAALGDAAYVARRIDVSGCEDGVRLGDDSELTDSYVHDLAGSETSHYDGVGAEGARGWVVRNNTIINDHAQTSALTIGLGASDGLVERNYLAGGGYTLYAGPEPGTGIRVRDNVFSTSRFENGGMWGPVTYWGVDGNDWVGNVWADGSEAGSEVLP